MSRSYRIKNSQSVTLTLLSGGKGENESASSPFGPVKAGLTTPLDLSTVRASQDQQLSELLNTLEKQVEILQHKFYEVYVTYNTDIKPLAEQILSKENITTTEESE